MDTPGFVRTIHTKAYPAIDPTRPALSAAGKTVLVTGGATGIGFEMARNFAAAGASTLVLVARRATTLEEASAAISQAYPSTQVLTFVADIADPKAVSDLFKYVTEAARNHSVNVLVTSAAHITLSDVILKLDLSALQDSFATNVLGNLNLVRGFLESPSTTTSIPKTILDVSTNGFLHMFPSASGYGATKLASTFLMRHVQAENPEVRVHSFHPGVVFTPSAANFGIKKEMIAEIEDDISLPGGFAVWLASPEADFTKGRYLYAKWDVEDLVKNKAVFEKDSEFSTITLRL
ncbi:NAD(P)-binding protein [Polyplosphaeria fusca]|uniref:NAD(P)-binding protein n=1 Tax=Polyplosphaeria fusca TaxID=682080 RepID=A0A9P4R8N0_9PLEO|nr:NAD(P)-binding protein [Polyplosphaeria fusca]